MYKYYQHQANNDCLEKGVGWGLQEKKLTSASAHSIQFSPPRRTPHPCWILMLWCSRAAHHVDTGDLTKCWKATWRTFFRHMLWTEAAITSVLFAQKPIMSLCQVSAFEDKLWGRLLLDDISHVGDKPWILPGNCEGKLLEDKWIQPVFTLGTSWQPPYHRCTQKGQFCRDFPEKVHICKGSVRWV